MNLRGKLENLKKKPDYRTHHHPLLSVSSTVPILVGLHSARLDLLLDLRSLLHFLCLSHRFLELALSLLHRSNLRQLVGDIGGAS